MTLDLAASKKAVAALIGSVVTQAAVVVAVKVGLDPALVVGLGATLTAAATRVVYKIPNKVTL